MLVEAYIKKLYDKEIRNKCESLNKRLIYCFDINENNCETNCKNEIKAFHDCTVEFDKDFREKYDKVTKNMKTIY